MQLIQLANFSAISSNCMDAKKIKHWESIKII